MFKTVLLIQELMIITHQVKSSLLFYMYLNLFVNFLVAWFRHNATKKEKETLINYLQKEGDPEA